MYKILSVFLAVFTVKFPCTGKKGGMIDISYLLNYTTSSPKFLDGKLELKVKRQCYKKGKLNIIQIH